MQRHEQDGIAYLTYSLLASLPHATFLRHGGVSEGPFQSLNFSITPGDQREHVAINRQRAQMVLGISQPCQLIQEHGDRVIEARPGIVETGDGLMTDVPGLPLMVMHADCQATLFYDPVNRAIAAIHCGWRGNVCQIYQKTVSLMHERYNTNPADLQVVISPSLGPEASEFIHYEQELPASFLPYKIGKYHFDLWAISQMQLEQAGVKPDHIECARLCTYANHADYFSYRRAKKSGRHATMIALPAAS